MRTEWYVISTNHLQGIRGKTHRWIRSFLTQRKQRVMINGDFSEWVNVDSSVPQGTVTGPLMFLMFINDLPGNISSNVRLFADDCILYRTVSRPSDANILQADLDTLTKWQFDWQMMFNAKKCYVLSVTHSKAPLKFTYNLNHTQLQATTNHTYLGVSLTHDLSWSSHINNTTAKANRSLGFLRRNLCSCSKNIKDMAYKTLVRPILEYCSSVWDPHTQNLINQVEAVQNRAARFVSGIYGRNTSITQIKKSLGWDELATRRKVTRLSIFQQALGGNLAIPARNILRPVQRSSRSSSPNTNNFTNISANKNCYKYSFIPRTLSDWNQLPKSITSIIDKNQFKSATNKHFKIKEEPTTHTN